MVSCLLKNHLDKKHRVPIIYKVQKGRHGTNHTRQHRKQLLYNLFTI